MLHQKPDAFENRVGSGPGFSEPRPSVFDADAYLREMRALGVEFTVCNCVGESRDDYIVTRGGTLADADAVAAVESKWALIEPDRRAIDESVGAALDEELMFGWAFHRVGNDLARGLVELRRLDVCNKTIYAAEMAASDADPEALLDYTKAAHLAADKGSHEYYYMLRHLWLKVPIRSFDDVGLKSCLAAEFGDYFDDNTPENLRYGVLEQIAAFYERRQAFKWIDGARKAGLSVFPWHGSLTDTSNRGVMQFGQDEDGPNNYGAATRRFLKSRACSAVEGLREGIVFDALCEYFDVDPNDIGMCHKVNAKLHAAEQAREARAC